MAIKRIFNVRNNNRRTCLKCGMMLPLEQMKDDTVCACASCGQEMFVDRYAGRIALTICERPEVRRRLNKEETYDKKAITKLKEQLAEAQKEKKEWEEIAAELALEMGEAEANDK